MKAQYDIFNKYKCRLFFLKQTTLQKKKKGIISFSGRKNTIPDRTKSELYQEIKASKIVELKANIRAFFIFNCSKR